MVKPQVERQNTPSMEDYLEAIAMLRGEDKVARVSQISQKLKVKMPSVTSALRKLSEKELVLHQKYGYVELTTEGDKMAQDIIRRHKALSRFFTEILDIERETAEEDACKIEHVISPLGLERIIKFIEFVEACPQGEANLPKRYKHYLEPGELPEDCLGKGLREKK